MYFTVILSSLVLLGFDKELLGMRTDLSARSGLDEILDPFPVFSIKFQSVKKLFMFLFGPSSCSSGINVNKSGHSDILLVE